MRKGIQNAVFSDFLILWFFSFFFFSLFLLIQIKYFLYFALVCIFLVLLVKTEVISLCLLFAFPLVPIIRVTCFIISWCSTSIRFLMRPRKPVQLIRCPWSFRFFHYPQRWFGKGIFTHSQMSPKTCWLSFCFSIYLWSTGHCPVVQGSSSRSPSQLSSLGNQLVLVT